MQYAIYIYAVDRVLIRRRYNKSGLPSRSGQDQNRKDEQTQGIKDMGHIRIAQASKYFRFC